MTNKKEELKRISEPRHIGDGVYISYDGYHVNVAVNHHLNHVVAFDPDVQGEIVKYINSINEILKLKE